MTSSKPYFKDIPVVILDPEEVAAHLVNEPNFPCASSVDIHTVKAWIRALDTGVSNKFIKIHSQEVLEYVRQIVGVTDAHIEAFREKNTTHPAPTVTHPWASRHAWSREISREPAKTTKTKENKVVKNTRKNKAIKVSKIGKSEKAITAEKMMEKEMYKPIRTEEVDEEMGWEGKPIKTGKMIKEEVLQEDKPFQLEKTKPIKEERLVKKEKSTKVEKKKKHKPSKVEKNKKTKKTKVKSKVQA